MEIKEISTKSEIKEFVNFQFALYKNNKYWVPPIKADEQKAISKEKNPAYDFCDAKFFLAYDNGKVVGRIGAIINHDYNKKVNKKFGRFNRIEFIDNYEVSKLLIETAKNWFKQEGIEFIHGPLGFTNLDTQGLLIEGFDYLPSVASVYHLSYYKEHLDKLGFEKENDWIEFRLTVGEAAQKKASRGASLIKRRYGFDVVKFEDKSEMQKYGKKVFEILNDAFDELPYVTRFNDKMIELYSEKYFKVLNPDYIRLVKKDDELIGFIVGVPSLSEAMQKAKGKLYPLGFTHVLKAMKNPTVIDMFLTGVKHEYHSAGVAVILFAELQEEMLNNSINTIETTGIFETNHNVISNWKNYEHIQHKRRRCYVASV